MMKKRTIVSTLLALALMIPMGLFAFITKVQAEGVATQTTTPLEIANAVKTGITGSTSLVGDGDVFDYTLGVTEHTVTNSIVSTLFTTWKDFDTASGAVLKFGTWDKANYNLSGSPYGPYFNATTTDSSCMVRVNWMQNITYKLTFNKAAVLTVTNEALSGIATTDNVIRIRVYKESDGQISRLSETPLYDGANTSQAANYFGGEYTMSAGESFYFEYGCTGSWEKSLTKSKFGTGIFPTFTAEEIPNPNAVSVGLLDLVADAYTAKGADVVNGAGTFTFLHGTYENNKRFDVFSGNALQTTEKNSNNYASVYVGGANKQIRTNGADDKMILKYTTGKNVCVDVTSPATNKASNWQANYSLTVERTVGGATYRKTVLQKTFSNVAYEANAFSGTYHLLAGDTLYLEIYAPNDTTNVFLMPTFTVDPDAYAQANTVAFQAQTLNLTTIGATCRVDGEAGLRFKNSVSANGLQTLTENGASVQLGTLLIPQTLVGTNLTENSAKVLNVAQTVWFETDATNNYFNAVLLGLGDVNDYAARYQKVITARAYAKVTCANGTVEYVYANAIERSMLYIAKEALADTEANFSPDVIDALEKIVRVCEG